MTNGTLESLKATPKTFYQVDANRRTRPFDGNQLGHNQRGGEFLRQPADPGPRAKLGAASLSYDGNLAPFVVEHGESARAEEILRTARRYGIPIVFDGPLSTALIKLGAGRPIPETLYSPVAEYLLNLRLA